MFYVPLRLEFRIRSYGAKFFFGVGMDLSSHPADEQNEKNPDFQTIVRHRLE